MKLKTKVILFKIIEPKSKLLKIIQTSYHHFSRKEKLLIRCPDEMSMRFVDDLLWKEPKESFLPHIATLEKSNDFICITKSIENLNDARFLINLNPDFLDIDSDFKTIYDFDDNTTVVKKEKSQKRIDYYRSLNYQIELGSK